jgi:hypothetical protein
MSTWRQASAFLVVVALLLNASTVLWAEGSNKRTDTFEQRFPPDQMPTPPGPEQPWTQPPVRQAPTQHHTDQLRATPKSLRQSRQGLSPRGEQPDKLATVTTAQRVTIARHSRSRVVVPPRSFLDAGTEVVPGDRKFLDYALLPLHTPTDVVTNTGGRVGWHNWPLPGPLFPSAPQN